MDRSLGTGTAHRDFGIDDPQTFIELRESFFGNVFSEEIEEVSEAIDEARRCFAYFIEIMDQCHARGAVTAANPAPPSTYLSVS